MRLLLDTQALFWWVTAHPRLSPNADTAIRTSFGEVHVSGATAWEIAIKVGSGKWSEAEDLINDFEAQIAAEHFLMVPILVPLVRLAGALPGQHRDPFDRLLVAQAMTEGLTLVTADKQLTGLGGAVLW